MWPGIPPAGSKPGQTQRSEQPEPTMTHRNRAARRAAQASIAARRASRHPQARPHEYATTGTPCSCVLCGNPRRHRKGRERLTMAERRAFTIAE